MKFLIALIFNIAITLATPTYYHGPPAPIDHDGRVMDTPEVAHAKAIHLAIVAEAAARVPRKMPSYTDYKDYHGYSEPVSMKHRVYHDEQEYDGPLAPLDNEGRVVDTPEVERAKAAHLEAYNRIASLAPLTVNEDNSHIYKPTIYNRDYHDSTDPSSNDDTIDNSEYNRKGHFADYANVLHDSDEYDDY